MANIRLSHIGVIVKDIKEFSRTLEDIFGARPVSETVKDTEQKAFLKMYKSGESFIELISPASEDSNVQTALKRMGEGLAHLCFETDNLEETLDLVRKHGALVFTKPTPAVLFNRRKVAFAILPNKMIVEFLEVGEIH
jgi:methylmalonyl-CoA/ethylmalonyl-CoA epimerase